jgi:RHS repeat-associated protein
MPRKSTLVYGRSEQVRENHSTINASVWVLSGNGNKCCSFLLLVSLILMCSFVAPAQNNPNEEQGLKPYDTWHGGDLDSTSVTSGGTSLHIPLASFPQRADLDLSFFVSSSNKQWYTLPPKFDRTGKETVPPQWAPMPNTGVQIVTSLDWWLNSCSQIEPSDPNAPAQTLYDWSDTVSSPDGSSHLFGDQGAVFSPETFPVRSLDGTGLMRPDAHTLVLPNGTRYGYPSVLTCAGFNGRIRGGVQPTSVTDSNGNQITINSSGWTDTMGRFIPGSIATAVQGIQAGVSTTDLSKCPAGTSSARIWNVPGVAAVNAGIRTFYFCYSMVSLYTDFDTTATGGATNYGPVSTSLLSAVVLPDLTQWTFTYDHFGDVLHVGFPTGGSLNYTYGIGPRNSGSGTSFSTWTLTRTIDANDGSGPHQWTYNYQGDFPTGSGTAIYTYSAKGVATVTDPDGDDVVHTIGPGGSGGCPGYVYQTQYFQGNSDSGTLLKTVQTQYDCVMGTPGGDLTGVALNVEPTQVTTIWPGGKTSKVLSRFDQPFDDPNGQTVRIGSLLQKDEYDFSNALVRSTLNRFWWQDNSTFLNNNFISLPEWTTVYNGAAPQSSTLPACSSSTTPACIGQTKYMYDEGSIASSGIGAPTHVAPPASMRGNPTTVSRWLDTANAFVSSHSSYFDTGMKQNSSDPLGHVTGYSYSGTFLGAYLTQTNLPDTQMPDPGAPVVHHVVSGNYDFNTGRMTSFTDGNGRTFSYTYDNMLRLTEGDHPDGGVTRLLYPDANTIERQRLISGTTYNDSKVKFDGVGRPYETLYLTPDCASYIKVDTTYDAMGRTKNVSNPYCLTTEPTYGITQTEYDGLSRVTKTTKQDGSVVTTAYNDTAGDSSGPPTVCTTGTDEAGKKRQSCTDAFGRLVKVVEPNPGSIATKATGWVLVSGAEESAQSQPALPGSVSITIGGSNAVNTSTVCSPTTGACHTFTSQDSGTLSFTAVVGGVTVGPVSTSYSSTSSLASLAAGLYTNFPANSAVSMSNPNGTNMFTLTTKATGSSMNNSTISTSMVTSCADTDTMSCGGPGWTMTLSGPTLSATTVSPEHFSGGQNGATTADSGQITATINGTPYQVSFGSGDTSSTIASRLASAITEGSWATATASDSTINLTSKASGMIGDYALSASYTWNTAQFTSPSFTTSTSGAALSGAKDAGGLNNNPYVTTYQYNSRGDLLCVHQKATDTTADVPCTGTTAPAVPAAWRQRFFTYDMLSRILTAMNPETNSTGSTKITYTYDNDGNLISKNEPAPNQPWGSAQTATVNYSYDALDRLLDTTYIGSNTPSSSHRYDYSAFSGVVISNPVGREVASTANNGTISHILSYDSMGRISQSWQCNPGVTGCKSFTTSYDKLGNITTLGYPDNFTMTYGYDSAARLTSASDSAGVIYAQAPIFWATGSIKEFTSPNFNNNKFHVDLNNRLQPIELWAGSSQGAGALFDKQYSYGSAGSNNGNVFRITNLKDSTRTQTFGYDLLNRLSSAQDAAHWSNTYTYDPWGNLSKKLYGPIAAGEHMDTSADWTNHLLGYSYDAAGNMMSDGVGGNFSYDAEDRIIAAGSATYTYDADGRRIQKTAGINYWYGPTGAVLGQTDASGTWTNYIFFGGQRLARNVNGDIKYYIKDHLRSTAMFVDKAGTPAAILDDNDLYPWGGAVPGVGRATSNNTIKFSGQYRDSDTALQTDYFGARYYANSMGRYMSPDWAARPVAVPYANFGDPQSLNLYSYVGNNPLNEVDPTGHEEVKQDTVSTTQNDDGSTTTTTEHTDSSSTHWYNVGTSCNPVWVSVTVTTGTTTSVTTNSQGGFAGATQTQFVSRSETRDGQTTTQTVTGKPIQLQNPPPPSYGNQMASDKVKLAGTAGAARIDPAGAAVQATADVIAEKMDEHGVTNTGLALASLKFDPLTWSFYALDQFSSLVTGSKAGGFDSSVKAACEFYLNPLPNDWSMGGATGMEATPSNWK